MKTKKYLKFEEKGKGRNSLEILEEILNVALISKTFFLKIGFFR